MKCIQVFIALFIKLATNCVMPPNRKCRSRWEEMLSVHPRGSQLHQNVRLVLIIFPVSSETPSSLVMDVSRCFLGVQREHLFSVP